MDWYFHRWNAQGDTDRIHSVPRDATRDAAGRDSMAQRVTAGGRVPL